MNTYLKDKNKKAKQRREWVKALPVGLLLVGCASLLAACVDRGTLFHAFRSIPTAGWQQADTLCFDVAVPDSQTYYRLSVEVRHRNNYPYQNLDVAIRCESPDSLHAPTDTLRLILADSLGIWKGDGWGGLYQIGTSAGSIRISRPGIYRFKLTHTFPDQTLPGLNDVGIKLVKNE